MIEPFEHVHSCARQKRIIQLERRIFRRRPDECQSTVFDVGQECVLLRFVKAMNLIQKQHGGNVSQLTLFFGLRHRRANVFHTGHYRRKRNKVRVCGLCNHSRKGGFAGSRRSPENHRMGAPLLDRLLQWFTGGQQVILTREIVQHAWPHPVGQWPVGLLVV